MKYSQGRWILALDLPDHAEVLIKGGDLKLVRFYILELEAQLQRGIEIADQFSRLHDDLKKENADLRETLFEIAKEVAH